MNKYKWIVVIIMLTSSASFVPAQAYRQPVSNQFMAPHCPLLANGEKNPACLYIPKAQCDYFVSKQGNDSNAGTEANPFATIQKGVDQLNAGDTLCIKGYADGSSYTGGALINNKHGNENAWITIGGYESSQPVVNKGNNYSGGVIAVKNSSYIRIKGIETTKANNGFTVETSDNIDLINLKAHDNWEWGIGVPSNNGPSARIRVEHAKIFNNQRRHYNNNGKGGVGAQFNNVAEGAFRYNMVYRNLNEGFDVHMDSNQIIVEQNFFSENNHTAFYVNHSSNVLYNRNLTICTGEKPLWADQIVKHGETDNLGTAITFRNESSDNNADRAYGGNHAIINNIVMGCTSHLIITPQVRLDAQGNPKPVRPMGSHLVAFNTFIDARKGGIGGEKEADFLQLKTDSLYYGEPVVFMNNLFKFDDPEGELINQPNAANINTIIFARNLTDQAPGFTEGITQTTLPFEQTYNHTSFLGDNIKPWDMSKTQLDTILRRAKLANNSPAINTALNELPESVNNDFKTRFLGLYEDYLHIDYFGNARNANSDIGAHEFDGVPGPTFTPGPTPTSGPTNTPGASPTNEPEDWDLNNNGVVNLYDFNIFIRRVIRGNQQWSNMSQFIVAFRADQE